MSGLGRALGVLLVVAPAGGGAGIVNWVSDYDRHWLNTWLTPSGRRPQP